MVLEKAFDIDLRTIDWRMGDKDSLPVNRMSLTMNGGPDSDDEKFFVPFVFSTNGRPYLKQIETESGTWFRDARKPFNHRRALSDWPTIWPVLLMP